MPLHIAAHMILHSPAASYAARAAGSSLLAGALARDLWRRIPEWIRQDIGFQDLFCTNDDHNNNFDDENADGGGGNDEMASLMAVIQKLQALVTTGYQKLGSTHKRQRRRRRVVQLLSSVSNTTTEDSATISTLEFHLALLAYVQLCNQIKERYPEWRDEMYDRYLLTDDQAETIGYSNNLLDELSSIPADDCSLDTAGTTATAASPVTEEQIGELIQLLDYSIMAYETNEGLLKSQLHENGGYQLLLHRTTSTVVDDAEDDNNNNGEDESPSRKTSRRKPPGRVGYYAAVSPSENTLLIGIKGTSTLEELLTDCCGRAVRCELENNPHYRDDVVDWHDETDTLDEDYGDEDGESDNVQFSDSKDDHDAALTGPREKNADEDIICNGEVLESKLCDQSTDIDQADTSRASSKDDHDAALTGPWGKNAGEDIICNGEVLESKLCDQSPDIDQADTSRASSKDDHDAVLTVPRGKNADEDIICNDEVLESKLCDQSPDIDQADTSRASLSSSSYEYFELKTIDDGNETVEVELLIDSNPNQTEIQQQQRTKRKENHPSENILLFPAQESRSRLLQELPISATMSTIEDNGIEMQPHRSAKLRGAHEGILHSAQQLLQEISPLIEEYALSKGFDVVCCGHSLGAGAASLLAILIRGKYASLVTFSTDERRDDNDDTRKKSERVRAYAFAPPPLLDRLSSLACRHYVTSVVNNSDIIPRSSLTNLDVLMTVLEAVICVLTEASMNPAAGADSNNPIPSSIALFRKLSEGTNGKLVIEPRELKRIQKEAIYEATWGDGGLDESYWNEEGDHHLLVPGKVLLLYQKWCESEKKKKLTDSPGDGDGDGDEATERDVYNAVWTNGTVKMLKGFELGGGSQAVTDHLTVSYTHALKCCMKGP
jgi:hypothetical protein